ncbi:CPBP family intramembrane glutamic endopeptidase [Desulfosporosinus sp.]|uniref:CPBP family intramembrane glutamic endopeptidase n=1 Tax=Desulfosporosinus sp. TaxID=157907 RepID=UPI000E920BFE|nr:CPBP family intramembrane glutamic endopeptidase [Desulfosporosinus sp.]MBC2723310.1 CPBP family intramembrane metalloprotease [Desulfosporosinus sp.]MBC2726112.1 CPBP family intramembrane metalloprotease [Desulfosporosinus sp.]HBV87513.1 CPBP family intramembrane metalloprotease [Desulfosporosinus sp.]
MGKKKDLRVPPRKPVWNIWQGLLIVAVVTLIEYPLGWLESPKDLDSSHGILSFIGVGLGDVLLYFIVIWIFLKLIRRPFADLGFVKPLQRYLVLGFIVGTLLFVSIGLLGNLLTKLLGTPAPQSFAVAVKGTNSTWEFILLTVLGGVIAPIKEEMFFRGLIYPPLRQAFGRGKGILLTGLFFATLHLEVIRFLPLLIGGVVLTWLYERSSSIWPAVVAHGTWNTLMAVALWIQRY